MEWKEAFNYGLPTVILSVLVWALWRMILWAKTSVAEPVVAAHLKLVATLQESIPVQNAKLDLVAKKADLVAEKAGQVAEKATIAAEQASAAATAAGKQIENLKQTIQEQTYVLKTAIEKGAKL